MKEKEENRKLNNITMPSVEDKKRAPFPCTTTYFPGGGNQPWGEEKAWTFLTDRKAGTTYNTTRHTRKFGSISRQKYNLNLRLGSLCSCAALYSFKGIATIPSLCPGARCGKDSAVKKGWGQLGICLLPLYRGYERGQEGVWLGQSLCLQWGSRTVY